MKFWSLKDLEVFFDRSKQGVWILRKDPTFPHAIMVQGRQLFDSTAIRSWDDDRKKVAAETEKRRKSAALAELKAGAK
jgi:hypothetical protein